MILRWISHCKTTHAVCHLPYSSTPWHPTRLLDVAPGDDSKLVCLVQSSNLRRNETMYAALSHMWGDAKVEPPLRTMEYNYDEMIQGIP